MSLPFYLLNTLMDIRELEDFKLSDAVKFHNELNPNLWENNKLKPEVKDQLLKIANDFILELGVAIPKIKDITISGSNAAYSYTPYSDLDLHILIDFNELSDDEIYQELFTAKKNLYNEEHDIEVYGVPVELYVQDSNQKHVSLGEYSIVNDDWIRIPKKQKANFDQEATKAKFEKLGSMIELALKSNSLEKVEKVLDVLKRYRQAGLSNKGEFGPENLSYKALRNLGYIQKLYDYKNQLHSKDLSLEDYHPNAKPPGPEFPPTMPSGTIRVDVSDVYDWYKLGQHISDMEGLGKHDFGQGPPSTILSFGDEDLEHQYIDALKKTGLDTTDIDPKGHEPLKGQKVDPRYNVKESVKFIEGTNCKNCVWWKKDSEKPVGKDELNKYGGLKPPNKEYIAMSKRVDLVTLPGKDTVKEKGFCYHKDINDWVTERMCCAKWDGEGVIRDYKGESPLMESKAEAVRKIQKFLNKKYDANLDVDGILGPLTLQSINKFMPKAKKANAPEPDKTTSVQGKEVKEVLDTKSKAPFYKMGGGDIDRQVPFKTKSGRRYGLDFISAIDAHTKPRLRQFPKINPKLLRYKDEIIDNGVEVIFGQDDYMLDNPTGITGTGSAAEVFGIVTNKIIEYIKKLNPPYLYFTSFDDEPSRVKLYNALLRRVMPTLPGYFYKVIKIENSYQFVIFDQDFFVGNTINEVSGYIPSEKEKNDPRFKTALTVDVKPDSIKKNAKAFGWDISRTGRPPLLRK